MNLNFMSTAFALDCFFLQYIMIYNSWFFVYPESKIPYYQMVAAFICFIYGIKQVKRNNHGLFLTQKHPFFFLFSNYYL